MKNNTPAIYAIFDLSALALNFAAVVVILTLLSLV